LWLRLTDPIDPATWTELQRDLAVLIGSDPSVHDPPRIMRLPGFRNHKAPVAECRIVESDPFRSYTVEELRRLIPQREPVKPTVPAEPHKPVGLDVMSRAALYLDKMPGGVAGERGDPQTFRAACALTNDFGLTTDQAWPLLCQWNQKCSPPWDETELREKLDNAEKYAKKSSGSKSSTPTSEWRSSTEASTETTTTAPEKVTEPPSPAWVTPLEVMRKPEYVKGIPAITSGLASLDRLISGGFRTGCVTIIASRTGGAKSHLATNIARRSALAGVSVLFMTLEDEPMTATWRLHSAMANTPTQLLLDGVRGHGPAIEALRKAFQLFIDLPLRLSDVRDIKMVCDLIGRHCDGDTVERLVVIDQMSKIGTPHLATATAYERVNDVSERLRLAAMANRVPVVVIVQVNREASKRGGDLQLHDLRDSGMLEQDAACVLLIDSAMVPPAVTGQPRTLAKILPVRLAKQRFGPAGGVVKLLWHPRTARIDDLAMEGER